MKACIEETDRRRSIQMAYNEEHNIKPETIKKAMQPGLRDIYGLSSDEHIRPNTKVTKILDEFEIDSIKSLEKLIQSKTKEMKKAAANLQFERAAELRDIVDALKDRLLVHSSET
jgi:excinuclease ABC subunit B